MTEKLIFRSLFADKTSGMSYERRCRTITNQSQRLSYDTMQTIAQSNRGNYTLFVSSASFYIVTHNMTRKDIVTKAFRLGKLGWIQICLPGL